MTLRYSWLLLLVCSLLALTGCHTGKPAAAQGTAKGSQKLVLDVRTPEEFAAGHLPGAVNLPVDQVATRAAQVVPDKSTPVFVHCQGGHRSAQAKATLDKLGYTNVTDLGSYENARRVVEGN